MLSWFKKQSQPTKDQPPEARVASVASVAPPASMPPARTAAGELIERWDAMIVDNRHRLQVVLEQAVVGSQALIESIHLDLTPLVLPWNAIAPRVHEFREEVSELWNRISDEMSGCDGFSHEMMRREGRKRDLASAELELLHERAYGGVMARAADRMRVVALGTDAVALTCNNCGAKLDQVKPVSQSLNVECGSCNAVNTVHPRDALRMFAASGAMFLAVEEARPTAEAMKRLEIQIKQYRDAKDVPLGLLIDCEATTQSYWKIRLSAEARYNPDEAKYLPTKLERHMKDAHKTLRRYWQWRDYETSRPT